MPNTAKIDASYAYAEALPGTAQDAFNEFIAGLDRAEYVESATLRWSAEPSASWADGELQTDDVEHLRGDNCEVTKVIATIVASSTVRMGDVLVFDSEYELEWL